MARPTELISIVDPAIDRDNVPPDVFAQYVRTRDAKLIRPYLHPHVKPMVFHIREIPRKLWAWVTERETDQERVEGVEYAIAERAFQAAIVQVTGCRNEDDQIVTWDAVRGPGDVVHPNDLNRFSPLEIHEVGAVAYHASFLPRRIEPVFLLPRTLFVAWNAQGRRHVGASQPSPRQSNDEASSPTTAESPQASRKTAIEGAESANDSGSPTGATAPETR